MNKKWRQILLLGPLFVGGLLLSCKKKSEIDIRSKKTQIDFVQQDQLYTISFPADWEYSDNREDLTSEALLSMPEFKGEIDLRAIKGQKNFRIQRSPREFATQFLEASLEKQIDALFKAAKVYFKDKESTFVSKRKVRSKHKRPGVLVEHTLKDGGERMIYITVFRKKPVMILLFSKEKMSEIDKAEFEKIVKTLDFSKKGIQQAKIGANQQNLIEDQKNLGGKEK